MTIAIQLTNKSKRGYGGACGGFWRILLLARVWSQVFGFVLVPSFAVKMVLHLIHCVKTFYKLCTFNAIFEGNVATNYIKCLP